MASLFSFENLYSAYLDCRRKKRGKKATQRFEVHAEEDLFALAKELTDRSYHPSPSFCFVSRNDKFREVFAAQFRDRVVHHLIVRYLEKIWEPVFIHDSYACRKGKGTHAAVNRLQSFSRKITSNNTKRAWCLKLDIKAFFPSIDRRLLLDIVLSKLDNEELRWLVEIIILHDPANDAIFTCSASKWKNIPPHKSLFSVPEGKGLPIGNLTSQFFANIYLNPLDEFVKHTLKTRFYIRYVDDLVLLHESREQLLIWNRQIGEFLHDVLKLVLHPDRQHVHPVSNGVNALGYIVRPSHLLLRRRVVDNCKRAIVSYQNRMMCQEKDGMDLIVTPERYKKFEAMMNSYLGIFSHASTFRLVQGLFQRFRVLRELFVLENWRVIKRWEVPFCPRDLYTQYRFFRSRFRGVILFQVGCFLEMFDKDAVWAKEHLGLAAITLRKDFYARCGVPMRIAESLLVRLLDNDLLLVMQSRYVHGRIADRVLSRVHFAEDRNLQLPILT